MAFATYHFPIWTQINPAPISVYTGLVFDSRRVQTSRLHTGADSTPTAALSRGRIAIWFGPVWLHGGASGSGTRPTHTLCG